MIGIFRKQYTIRKYLPQVIERGYASSQCIEITSQLNVQPLSTDELRALPEGERTVKKIKSYGSDQMASADASTQTPGDRLFYHGQWYECVSSEQWEHTILAHYRSEWVLLAQQDDPPKAVVPP